MPLKLVNATELRPGTYAVIENAPCVIKSVDISKTGKHGASKCRIEAIGIIDEKKRITVMPGSERVEIPLIEKRRAQVLSFDKQNAKANAMDLENFETIDLKVSSDLLDNLKENDQVEYWNVEGGQKIIKRKI
ncbi:MAG: translation initiation factor IF-5A [Candidatus Pacearchaeota archaeon]|nr:translation initiation factor IF-5A [Candidatus Pacearchaeota archaeon]